MLLLEGFLTPTFHVFLGQECSSCREVASSFELSALKVQKPLRSQRAFLHQYHTSPFLFLTLGQRHQIRSFILLRLQ